MSRILIVEDDPDIAAPLRDDLALEGYDVEAVGDGETALQRLEESRFDLLLLDVMLPGADGFEVCRRLRQAGSRLPILLLTAKTQEAEIVMGLELGADDYITKPFSPRELRARIKAALRRNDDTLPVFSFGDVEVDFERVEVRRAGERGVDRPRIRIYDPQGQTIRTFTVNRNHALDRLYSLRNGLSVTVGEGFLVNRDTAVFQVFDGVGSAVDPDKAFNGLRNDNPNLQFGLPAIVNNSFQVNGEPIAVTVSDSVNSVIARINQSAAGVTATFNPLAEQIEFVQNTPGEAPTIALTDDFSNFLQATKLSSAVVTPGKDPDNERPLEDVSIFAAAQSGNFAINGQSIAVDVQNDSLDDVVARINSADVGAVASFDAASRQVTLTAADGVSELDIDSNGTGLFPALNLPEGRVDPEARTGGINPRRVKRIVDSVAALADGLNALYSNRGLLNGKDPQVVALRNQLETAVASVLGGGAGRLDSNVGLRFNRDRTARDLGKFVEVDRRKLTLVLERSAKRVGAFFNGTDKGAGFTAAVAGAVGGSIRSLSSTLGSRGTLIDSFA